MKSIAASVKFEQGLEHIDYVTARLANWGGRASNLPTSMTVIEYWGDGDPFFGGQADDRSLGKSGSILPRPTNHADVAVFATIEEAHEAAKKIPNRREGSILGVAPSWD